MVGAALVRVKQSLKHRGQKNEGSMKKNSYQYPSIITVAILALSFSGKVSAGPGSPADSSSSLKGDVKFEGTAPKLTRIDMSADPICAKAHPTPVTTEEVVVGANSGLSNVVVYVSDGLAP